MILLLFISIIGVSASDVNALDQINNEEGYNSESNLYFGFNGSSDFPDSDVLNSEDSILSEESGFDVLDSEGSVLSGESGSDVLNSEDAIFSGDSDFPDSDVFNSEDSKDSLLISNDENTLSNEKNKSLLSLSSNDQSKLQSSKSIKSSNGYDYTTLARVVKYYPQKSRYVEGNTIYYVRAYDIVKYNGLKYMSPLYNCAVLIKVFTGNNYKNYAARIGENGIAPINIPRLPVGVHKIVIYFANKKVGTSTLTVLKSKAKIYAPLTIVKHNSKSYFYIKVTDRSNVLAKNFKLNLKVFTGSRYNNFTVKTNLIGLARIYTGRLSLGVHKVIINSSDRNMDAYLASRIIVNKTLNRTVLKLNADAPLKTVKVNQSNYFTIKVSDYFGLLKKGIPLKLIILNNGRFKTFNIKTDSKGIVKFNTNKLALGTYNVIIRSGSEDYVIKRSSKIIVRESLPINKSSSPRLISLDYSQKDGKCSGVIRWNARINGTYQILRKLNGSYYIVATVKANSTDMSFSNNIVKDKLYTYSVRQILKNSANYIFGPYDRAGIKLTDSPRVWADFQNLKTVVQWTKIPNAIKYIVFRKIGKDGTYKNIATVDAGTLNYTDYYYNSKEELSELLNKKLFIDPSNNNLFYTIRACVETSFNGLSKASIGLYCPDGDFHLESPRIVSLKDNVLQWGNVSNAEGYLILKKGENDVWQQIADVSAENGTVQSFNLEATDNNSYYAVQAYAMKNGNKVYSGYESGFSLKDFSLEHSNEKILYIGDSITYGSPYISNATDRHIFSMAYRVEQLLGVLYYNPSISGSTYHDLGPDNGSANGTSKESYSITTDVIDPLFKGEAPVNSHRYYSSDENIVGKNTPIEDYDIVVLAAGTNDYGESTFLGTLDSNDTSTFNGALNYILGKIEDSSIKRIEKGYEPIKIVFVDLFYSELTSPAKDRNNRDISPNGIGLTLKDYQNELTNQLNRWDEKTDNLSFYNFKTRDYDFVNNETCPYASVDNLHYTKYTYAQYGNAFAQFLLDTVF